MKTGRPSNAAPREPLRTIAVRLPAAIIAEIDRRVAALSPGNVGRRSAVVRDALSEAFSVEKK